MSFLPTMSELTHVPPRELQATLLRFDQSQHKQSCLTCICQCLQGRGIGSSAKEVFVAIGVCLLGRAFRLGPIRLVVFSLLIGTRRWLRTIKTSL